MPKRTIDLDALERVVGRAPRRFPMGDPRNLYRLKWWNRAVHALGLLFDRAGAGRVRRVVVDDSVISCRQRGGL